MALRVLSVFLAAVLVLGCGGRAERNRESAAADCASSNPCLRSYFDEAEQRCVTESTAARCDDANPCTIEDRCDQNGTCSGKTRDCEDGRSCTLDRCDPKLGCVHSTDPELCDDKNPCTRDVCTEASVCRNEPDTGNTCGGSDCIAKSVCREGDCVSQPVDSVGVCYPASIDFGDVIVGMTAAQELVLEATEGRLEIVKVQTEHAEISIDSAGLPRKLAQGEKMDVSIHWTPSQEGTLDTRVQVHTATPTWHVQVVGRALPQPNCDDKNPCTADKFDTKTGACSNAVTDGASCEDGNPCTLGDRCHGAVCRRGGYMDCPEGEVCKAGKCAERLCLRGERLSAICAQVGMPLGDGCLCELVYSTAPSDQQTQIDKLLRRSDFNQRITTSMFLGELLLDAWQMTVLLGNEGDQGANVTNVLETLSQWDLAQQFAVEGLTQPPNFGLTRVRNLFLAYDTLPEASRLPGILKANAFQDSVDNAHILGFVNTDARLHNRLLSADRQGAATIIARLNEILSNRSDPELINHLRSAFP